MTLAEFVEFVRRQDLARPDVQALAEALRAFGRQRAEIVELLERGVAQVNAYKASCYVLHFESTFTVRLVEWPPGVADTTTVHTHSAPLITYGLSGPGCQTLLHACDPEELRVAQVGDSVGLGESFTNLLAPDTTFFYPTDSLAHAQCLPERYSISLNLILHAALTPQYFINRETRRVTRIRAA